jgi:uncharacterized integral membrane protein
VVNRVVPSRRVKETFQVLILGIIVNILYLILIKSQGV